MQLKSGDTLIIATHNAGKLQEISSLLAPYGLFVNSAGNLGLDDPEETENTFEGNALLKAHYVASKTGHIALADDSGLVVPALNGQPGIYSARWGEKNRDFKKANAKVHEMLGDKPRDAYFICVLALIFPNGIEQTFEGRCHGALTWPERGEMGFGYDGMFVPNGETRTFGEMTRAEKSKISHRTKAFNLFKKVMLKDA